MNRCLPCSNSSNHNPNTNNQNQGKQTVYVFAGSTLILNFLFPYSLDDVTLAVVSANNVALENPTITIVDDRNATFRWEAEDIELLGVNGSHRFRVGATFLDGTQRNYNNIWVEIQ